MSISSETSINSIGSEHPASFALYLPVDVNDIFPDNEESSTERLASRNLLEISFQSSLSHQQLDLKELCSYEKIKLSQVNSELNSSSNKNSAHEMSTLANKNSVPMLPRMNTISYSLHKKLDGNFTSFPSNWKKYAAKQSFLVHNKQRYKTLLPNSFGCLLSRKTKTNFHDSGKPYLTLPLDIAPESLVTRNEGYDLTKSTERTINQSNENNNPRNFDDIVLGRSHDTARFYFGNETLDCVRNLNLPLVAKMSSIYPNYFSVSEKKHMAYYKDNSHKQKAAFLMMSLEQKLSYFSLCQIPFMDSEFNYAAFPGVSRYLDNNPLYSVKDENFYNRFQSLTEKTQALEKNITRYRASNLFRATKEPSVVKLTFENGRERNQLQSTSNGCLGNPLSIFGATQKLHHVCDHTKTQDLMPIKHPQRHMTQNLASFNVRSIKK